ncbi:amidohydrolase [Thermofilum pendens]|uniref:amidohydrolase n=1 Tax=Thermofilum pendens TaxID=2269 RepID=UPI00069AF3C3|nr:amidohydrolase [Thermofilum pendens]
MKIAFVNAFVPWSPGSDSVVYSPSSGIVFVGSESAALKTGADLVVDVEGRVVVPGLVDAHMHLYSTALSLGRLDLRGVSSLEEIREVLKAAVKEAPPGSWIVGRGWDQEKLKERRMPTRFDIDDVTGDNPVVLIRVCGHVALLNTLALRKMGLLDSERGFGALLEKEGGVPTGIVYEDLVDYVVSRIPPPPPELLKSWILRVLSEYVSLGVTELHSMSVSLEELEAVQRVLTTLPIGYRAYVDPGIAELAAREYKGLVHGVKIFADGSFGARTAALREKYSDAETRGVLRISSEGILSVARRALSLGLQTAVHAIGDLAVAEALKAAEQLPRGSLRIEHASLTPPDILEKIGAVKPEIAVQPHFILSDTWITERLGERAEWVYAFKSLQARTRVYGSSDAPVEPINPWLGVYAAVERGCPEGLPVCRYTYGEKMSFVEALRLYTSYDQRRPSIVVLNSTRLPTSKKEYEALRAYAVLVGGKTVYRAPGARVPDLLA